ncbi:N-acyl homoserine lactonase family protein [uncultured Jannaschia sp.]|uniref:N-acyl homoserine lactonase family protein n=1 Tax=uncultured Jannaschia sp. TaxID=293347 RepID=UPI00261F3C06|nr:N-acyl homoserine lactonase family protein [uncultured Jannaschia sp.]
MTAAVRVEPVEVGRRCADSATFLLHVEAGREIEMAYRFWLLHGPGGIIAVDTGIDPDEAARRGITGIVPTERALAERGIDPGNIGTLILTHLHWDHVSALDAFPAAEVWLHRDEAAFFADPIRAHPQIDRYFSHHDSLRRLLGSPRLRLVGGTAHIAAGVSLMPLPGHTPGHQGVVVTTAAGAEIIVADAAPFNRNILEEVPNGILYDLGASLTSLVRIRAEGPAAVLTGHDPVPRLDLAEHRSEHFD